MATSSHEIALRNMKEIHQIVTSRAVCINPPHAIKVVVMITVVEKKEN